MKTLHSPAPWSVYEVTERTAFLSLAEDTFMRIEFFDMPEEQMEPNLALIAAAPELLAALVDLVERDRAEAAASGFTDDEMTWLEDARRAIAKAKGGRP